MFKMAPIVEFDKTKPDITDDAARILVSTCPNHVFDIEDIKGSGSSSDGDMNMDMNDGSYIPLQPQHQRRQHTNKRVRAIVHNASACTHCGRCKNVALPFDTDIIKLDRKPNSIQFNIESMGQYRDVRDVFDMGLEYCKAKSQYKKAQKLAEAAEREKRQQARAARNKSHISLAMTD